MTGWWISSPNAAFSPSRPPATPTSSPAVSASASASPDVSIQSQIINLLKDMQEELGLTYMFISHDLSVVKFISDDVGVMYLGQIVEMGDKKSIFTTPLHPYTQALLSAIPIADPRKAQQQQRLRLSGDPPSPMQLIPGCAFASRCPLARPVCSQVRPVLQDSGNGRQVACFAVTGWPDEPEHLD